MESRGEKDILPFQALESQDDISRCEHTPMTDVEDRVRVGIRDGTKELWLAFLRRWHKGFLLLPEPLPFLLYLVLIHAGRNRKYVYKGWWGSASGENRWSLPPFSRKAGEFQIKRQWR